MNKYREFKERTQNEFNNFPIGFAFNSEQFEESKKKLGVKDNSELVKIGCNGFIRKADRVKFHKMISSQNEEYDRLILEDTEGNGFIADIFKYELPNHEFGYTWDLEDTLDALDLTKEKVMSDKKYFNGINNALKEIYNAELTKDGYVVELD